MSVLLRTPHRRITSPHSTVSKYRLLATVPNRPAIARWVVTTSLFHYRVQTQQAHAHPHQRHTAQMSPMLSCYRCNDSYRQRLHDPNSPKRPLASRPLDGSNRPSLLHRKSHQLVMQSTAMVSRSRAYPAPTKRFSIAGGCGGYLSRLVVVLGHTWTGVPEARRDPAPVPARRRNRRGRYRDDDRNPNLPTNEKEQERGFSCFRYDSTRG